MMKTALCVSRSNGSNLNNLIAASSELKLLKFIQNVIHQVAHCLPHKTWACFVAVELRNEAKAWAVSRLEISRPVFLNVAL